jgi:hypothetical protein
MALVKNNIQRRNLVLWYWPTKKEIVLRRIFKSTYFRTGSSLASYMFNISVRLGVLKFSLQSCWRLKSSEMLGYVNGYVGWFHKFRNNIPQFGFFSNTAGRTSNLAFYASKGRLVRSESGDSKDSRSRKPSISAPQLHSCNAGTRTVSLAP